MHLPTKDVEVLGRGGGVDHLNVVLGAQSQEALDARRTVLGTLALVAVRQQHHQCVVLIPLVLGGHDVLVDDDLRTVDEVAELRFPQHQSFGVRVGISVLEAECRIFRQQRVVHPELLGAGQFGQRNPDPLAGVVDERRMTLTESATSRVLTGQTHRATLEHQRTEGQSFAGGPFDVALLVVRLGSRFELLGQLGMRREVRGVIGELGEDSIERGAFDSGVHVRQHANGLGRLGNLGGCRSMRARVVESHLQLALEVVERLLGFLERDVTTTNQSFDVQLAHTALLGDGLVHERLRVAGVIAFVVPMTAVTHHVDDDVLVETLAVFPRQSGHANACLGVVAVHMEDGRLHHLGHVAAIQR